MRAWLLGGCLSLVFATPLLAATRVTIRDLKGRPNDYYGETVSFECYYDKESPIWVSALPDSDEWIGFFVTGQPEKAMTWSGEYYNLVFAPRTMQEVIRQLRGGDKISVVGEGFHYHSESMDGAGIRVQQILRGWGSSAKAIGDAATSSVIPTVSATASASPGVSSKIQNQSPQISEKYVVIINGERYEGLRFGDSYKFDGVDFQVDYAK